MPLNKYFSWTIDTRSRSKITRNCDEQKYWMDISEEYPYPGMQCDSGPTRVLSLTIFVYKDNDGVDYISDEE